MAGIASTFIDGMQYLLSNGATFWGLLQRHLLLVLISEVVAITVAVPLGVLATRYERAKGPILSLGNVAQTIPPLAIIALAFPVLGLGYLPSVVALFIYALLPVLTNTIAGIESVDEGVIDAARGMGMTQNERLTQIELPLALPVIFAGIRTSTIINVGTAYLAFFIGGGGLGVWVISGINLFNMPQVVAGAVPGALLAISLDFILGRIEGHLGESSPEGTSAVA
ncbi:ABC transporter permease [Haloarcula sp. S1AR25-5A]|uniref:ABC transporter permease n=1 Tax=Haloarcula terrestris TaxID=2950533 RepID=A0AAE4F175_9EURY|nr:ABC transporter permease [Haloarcula terrestris]MDS0222421.1 ABC transporter permease [Haloarcula terrestris]